MPGKSSADRVKPRRAQHRADPHIREQKSSFKKFGRSLQISGQTSTHYTSSPIIGQSVLYVFKAAGSLSARTSTRCCWPRMPLSYLKLQRPLADGRDLEAPARCSKTSLHTFDDCWDTMGAPPIHNIANTRVSRCSHQPP